MQSLKPFYTLRERGKCLVKGLENINRLVWISSVSLSSCFRRNAIGQIVVVPSSNKLQNYCDVMAMEIMGWGTSMLG